jgi:hypothetical protein
MYDEISWDIDTPMYISIKQRGVVLFKISVHEVIESNPREQVMRHVEECNRTPWLKHWWKKDKQ